MASRYQHRIGVRAEICFDLKSVTQLDAAYRRESCFLRHKTITPPTNPLRDLRKIYIFSSHAKGAPPFFLRKYSVCRIPRSGDPCAE